MRRKVECDLINSLLPRFDAQGLRVTTNDLKFLKNLARHNEREWFQKHKAECETTQKNFLEIVSGLVFALSEFEEALTTVDPKSCLFRIYRDVRFSKDKSPYKTHLGAYICAGGRKSQTLPGYYLHIEPDGRSLFGAGLFMPDKPILERLRHDIAAPQSRIVARLTDKALTKQFPDVLEDDKAKAVPRGYAKDHPHGEYLKLRHFCIHAPIADSVVTGKKFLHWLAERGETLYQWNSLLMTAKG